MKFFLSTVLEFEKISSPFLKESFKPLVIDLPSKDEFKSTFKKKHLTNYVKATARMII